MSIIDAARLRQRITSYLCRYLGHGLLAYLFVSIAACLAAEANDNAAATKQAPPEKQLAGSERVTDGARFLKTLHELVLNPPLTPEKITAAFGWPVLNQNTDNKEHHTTFGLYSSEAITTNPSLTEYIDGKTAFILQLESKQLCVTADEVLVEFGNQFSPVFLRHDPPPDTATLSDTVKRNRKLFFDGPRYNIASPVTFNIHFVFSYGECFGMVFVIYPGLQDK